MPRRPPDQPLPRGYPPKHIDWEKVDEWLEYGCKGTEIAARLGISVDTLYDRVRSEKGVVFSTYASEKKASGDNMLRELQFKNARKGNVTMQIWLGKQRLDQKENPGAMTVPPEFAQLFNDTMKAIFGKQQEQVKEAGQIDVNTDETIISSDS